MNVLKVALASLLIINGYVTRPAFANEGFKKLCGVARMANRDGASGKQEMSASFQSGLGWSKGKADATANLIIRENCPGVW